MADHTGSHRLFETAVTITHMDGCEDSLTLEELGRYYWSYVEAPSEENLKTATIQSDNLQRRISCAFLQVEYDGFESV